MDGRGTFQVKALGPEPLAYWGSFQCKGADDPTSYRHPPGLNFTVTEAASGTFTVTMPSGLTLPSQPYAIVATAQFADLATDWFEVAVLGETTLTTTRTFVLQAHRSGTAREVANTAGNRINFAILATNSTGK